MCSVQAAGGRELRAVVGGCWRANSSPETSHPGEHLPVQGRGCSLQPFGSVGFGLPGHVDVCKEGTRSCDTARPSSPSPAPGHGAGADAHSPAREKRAPPHPHPFPPASGMSGAVGAPEEGKHILALGKPLPFPFQSHSPFSGQSAPCSSPHTQTQDSFLGRTRCDKAKSKPAACCWLLTIHPLILWE